MDGQIKCPRKINDYACGYIDTCSQQEKLSHLRWKCEIQHALLIPDLLFRGGRPDHISGVQHLRQSFGELRVSAKELRVVGLELLLLFNKPG